MSETILLLVYILAAFAFPFGIAFALRIYAEKWGDNKEAEPSETSNSYDYSSSDNNSGKSSNYKHTYKYSKRTYRPWEEEKKVVFRKQEGGFILLDWTNYKATCSIIALFSMVILLSDASQPYGLFFSISSYFIIRQRHRSHPPVPPAPC